MSRPHGMGPAGDIEAEEIHDVLRNRRRRLVLNHLIDDKEPVNVRELAEHIAAIEAGEDPPPRSVKQSVYVALLQTHLPKLDELGIVDYQVEGRQVGVGEVLDDVAVYLETVPTYGVAWAEYYAAVSLMGGLTVASAQLGTPLIAEVSPVVWAYGFFALLFVSAVYHIYRQGSSIILRVFR